MLIEWKERGDPLTKPTKNPKPNKNEGHDLERGDPLYSDMLEWLQLFRENLVDDRVPERRDSHASSSHESSLEPAPSRSVNRISPDTTIHEQNGNSNSRTKWLRNYLTTSTTS